MTCLTHHSVSLIDWNRE